MEVQNKQKLADNVAVIYKDLKPALLALAYRYRAANPHDTVSAWQSRAYEIVDRFDKGSLGGMVYTHVDNQNEMEEYNPDKHAQERFIKSLGNYLKQAFTNDLLKVYSKDKRQQERQEIAASMASPNYGVPNSSEMANIVRCDALNLTALTKFIEADYLRVKGAVGLSDAVQERFLLAMLNFCKEMMSRGEDWRNLIVVPDLDEEDSKKFFSYDFRSELEDGVRIQVCKLLVKETKTVIVNKLATMIDKNSRSAIQKRLSRYLYEYRGGMPKRLRVKMKNKEL